VAPLEMVLANYYSHKVYGSTGVVPAVAPQKSILK
jgi:hypothetical protein